MTDNNIINFPGVESLPIKIEKYRVQFYRADGKVADAGYTFNTSEQAVAFAQAVSSAHYIAMGLVTEWGVVPFEEEKEEKEKKD